MNNEILTQNSEPIQKQNIKIPPFNAPPSGQKAPMNKIRMKKLIVLTVIILVILGFSAWLLTINGDSKPSSSENTQQNQNIKETKNSTSSTGIFAYVLNNPTSSTGVRNAGGDVWTTTPDGKDKKQLTNSGNIGVIYSWSPDNKYLLISIYEGPRYLQKYALVNSTDGSIKSLETVKARVDKMNPVWLSNNEFEYVADGTLYKTNEDDVTSIIVQMVSTVPNFSPETFIISPNGKNVAFHESGSPEDTSSHLYFVRLNDTKSPVKLSDKYVHLVEWSGDNLYYAESKSIIRYTLDGKKEILFTHTADRLKSMYIAPDESSLIYTLVYSNSKPNGRTGYAYEIVKMYSLDLSSKKSKEILTLPPSNNIDSLKYSKDSSLVAYNLFESEESYYKAPMRVINLSDYKSTDICTSSCVMPTWQQ